MAASVPVAEAIYAKLASSGSVTSLLTDGSAGIYYAEAPENARHPLLLYYESSDLPTYALGKTRAWTEHRYTVEAIVESSSFRQAKAIADAVDAALSDATLTVSGVNVIAIEQIGAIPDRPETVGGVRFNHAGFDFRVMARA